MAGQIRSLEDLSASSRHALVIGVGGGGDVVGALATARFLELQGIEFTLGGLAYERTDIDPLPGPRNLGEVENARVLHPHAWMANPKTKTKLGVSFAESKMAAISGREVLLIDINGGVNGVIAGLEAALKELRGDLLVGVDVGGDSLARGGEPGLRSPLADSVMLAAFAALERRSWPSIWGVFGFGSDGELTVEEVDGAISHVAAAGGLLGAWGLTPKIVNELEEVIQQVETEASAIPVECARGARGEKRIRRDQRRVKMTPLTTLTFYLSPGVVFDALSKPARAVKESESLEAANDALHAMGLKTELDLERERFKSLQSSKS